MSLYESTFIVCQDASAQDANNIAKSFTDLVENMGGKVIKKEYWGLRTLAYLVKKNKKGHYIMLSLDAEDKVMKELERHYRVKEEVIKFLTIRVDKIDESPSLMMQAPAESEVTHHQA